VRKSILFIMLAVPAVALGRSSVSISFGGRGGRSFGRRGRCSFGRGVHFGRGGLTVHYSRRTSHSNLRIRFHSGASYYGFARGCYYGGHFGGYYGAPYSSGVYVYRGWHPYPPHLHRGVYAGTYGARLGPFTYTDAVIFPGGTGANVYGYRRRVLDSVRATAGGALGEAEGAAAHQKLPAVRLIDRGDDFFARGAFRRAVEMYRAAARKEPKDPMGALALGHGLFAVGAYREAAAELRRGLRLYPALVQVQMNRRDFYAVPAVFDAQLARLAEHVNASPADRSARFLLGYNYFFTQQYARAKEQFAALGSEDAEAKLFLQEMARRE